MDGRARCPLPSPVPLFAEEGRGGRFLAGCRHGIGGLGAGQFRLAEQPPYRRMEPQAGSNQFFNHCDKPVFSLHVQKFVAHDGTLRIRFQREKRFRKEDDGTKPSKRNRTDIAGGDIKKGVAIC